MGGSQGLLTPDPLAIPSGFPMNTLDLIITRMTYRIQESAVLTIVVCFIITKGYDSEPAKGSDGVGEIGRVRVGAQPFSGTRCQSGGSPRSEAQPPWDFTAEGDWLHHCPRLAPS